jgi:FAD:protein FMN transferase
VSERRWLRVGLTAAAVAALLTIALAFRSGAAFRTFEGEAMATRWRIALPNPPVPAPATADCLALFRRLDSELSEWRPGSPLSAVNAAAGERPVRVPEELFGLLDRSVALGRASHGAFDVSWAALWGLWDFRDPDARVPAPAAIRARLPLVGSERVVLDSAARTVFLPEPGMKLGLGAIAKGYALGRAAELLRGRGFDDFLLVGGGQVVARGAHGDRPWRVGLRDPRGGPDDYFARLDLADASLSTSADNESFFVRDGVRYHHILDPRTGWPATGLRSATVLDRDPERADALSTAVMVLGRERGLELAERLGAEAVVVDEHGEVATTPGLSSRLDLVHAPRGRDPLEPAPAPSAARPQRARD